MSQWTPGRTGPKAMWYRRATREFLKANPVCHICGHSGADQVDHHPYPASKYPQFANEPWNWKPSHGVKGCPVCPPNVSADKRRNGQPTRCNQAKGAKQNYKPSPRSRTW